MNPTETPTQAPPTPTPTETPPAAGPAPTPDPMAPAAPPAGTATPPTNPVATNQAASGGNSKMMLWAAVGVLVLLVLIYFLFLKK